MADLPPPPPVSNPNPASPPPPPPGVPAVRPPVAAATGGAALIGQFTGNAGWAIFIGLVTVIVPLAFNRVYFFLPIIGLILGVVAIVRRQVIGGVVAVILNLVGGIITIIDLTQG